MCAHVRHDGERGVLACLVGAVGGQCDGVDEGLWVRPPHLQGSRGSQFYVSVSSMPSSSHETGFTMDEIKGRGADSLLESMRTAADLDEEASD